MWLRDGTAVEDPMTIRRGPLLVVGLRGRAHLVRLVPTAPSGSGNSSGLEDTTHTCKIGARNDEKACYKRKP